MKTAVIWNEIEELKYAVIDGDLSKYHDLYINSIVDQDKEELLDELIELQGNWDDSIFCSIEQFRQAIVDGAKLVECGFIP
jgi:hypothetical protein